MPHLRLDASFWRSHGLNPELHIRVPRWSMVTRLREQWHERNLIAFANGVCYVLALDGLSPPPRNSFKTASALLNGGERIKRALTTELVNPNERHGWHVTEDRLRVLASLFYAHVMGPHFPDHETFDIETRAAAVMTFAIFHPHIDPTQVRLHPRDRYPFYESP